MRIAPPLLVAELLAAGTIYCADAPVGTWKLDLARSTFSGVAQPRNATVRIEPHAKGEIVTVDRTEANGSSTTVSTLLYLDGAGRDSWTPGCSGTEQSRRVDSFTVEFVRQCSGGDSIKLLRRVAPQDRELVLDITEQHRGGRQMQRRLMFHKQ